MIPSDLLSALRAKDPALWEKVDDPQILEFLTGKEKQAIIQGLLQDAIRARGWGLTLIQMGAAWKRHLPCQAAIRIRLGTDWISGFGDTEAAALCAAYLAALEKIRR